MRREIPPQHRLELLLLTAMRVGAVATDDSINSVSILSLQVVDDAFRAALTCEEFVIAVDYDGVSRIGLSPYDMY